MKQKNYKIVLSLACAILGIRPLYAMEHARDCQANGYESNGLVSPIGEKQQSSSKTVENAALARLLPALHRPNITRTLTKLSKPLRLYTFIPSLEKNDFPEPPEATIYLALTGYGPNTTPLHTTHFLYKNSPSLVSYVENFYQEPYNSEDPYHQALVKDLSYFRAVPENLVVLTKGSGAGKKDIQKLIATLKKLPREGKVQGNAHILAHLLAKGGAQNLTSFASLARALTPSKLQKFLSLPEPLQSVLLRPFILNATQQHLQAFKKALKIMPEAPYEEYGHCL